MGRDEVQEVVLPVTYDPPTGGTVSEPTQSTIEIIAMPNTQQVSSIDVHVSEPWIMTTHHGGNLRVWNYHKMPYKNLREIIFDLVVQAAKFIAHKKWVVAGDDNGYIHVHNYHEDKGVRSFPGHDGSITCLAVHPTHPFVLSSSDYDYLIKLWDWEKDWECTRTFQGHTNRVTQITFNPDYPSSFASASADGSAMIWDVNSEDHGITLDGHVESLVCVNYFTRPGGQHLIFGTTDGTVQIWNLEISECVDKLKGHVGCITAVNLHPELPLLITGSLDGTIRLWNSSSYNLENIIRFNLGEVYAFGFIKDSTRMVVGCQQGIAMMDCP
uniref:Coatomer subunit beta'-2 n=1 Tax=Triticum urartu TaxID=4572 RepID=A0A8R7U863_TRIUA